MKKPEATNVELIAAVREWDEQLLASVGIRGVHPWMRKLADRLEAAEAELTRRDTEVAATAIHEALHQYRIRGEGEAYSWLTEYALNLAAAPVSLEAAKVQTAWDAALGGAAWEAVHEHGAFRRDFPDQDYFEQVGSKVRAALATERTIR